MNGRRDAGRWALAVLAALVVCPLAGTEKTIETPALLVSDGTGSLPDAELARLADQGAETLRRVLAFWSADAGTGRLGKIRLVFDHPRREVYSSVLYWETAGGTRTRVVRVHGFASGPQMMAHKLTSAVFPNEDKLVRNMMGVTAESRVGNPLTFPMCGFASDDWVLTFSRERSLVPLEALGPDHASWGMDDSGEGKLSITDKARQHVAYAIAGSLGGYLAERFGIEKLKAFHRMSHQRTRPWREVFGKDAAALEADWLATVRATETSRGKTIGLLAGLVRKDAGTACAQAQKAAGARP